MVAVQRETAVVPLHFHYLEGGSIGKERKRPTTAFVQEKNVKKFNVTRTPMPTISLKVWFCPPTPLPPCPA